MLSSVIKIPSYGDFIYILQGQKLTSTYLPGRLIREYLR